LFNVVSQSVVSFSVSTISSPQTAGQGFGVTVTARDGAGGTGNVATDFNGTVNLAIGGTGGTLTPTASGSFVNGVWNGNITVQSINGTTTGKTLSVDDGSGHTGVSGNFTVNPGPLNHFTFNNISSPQIAGSNFSVTLNARDAFSNAVSHTGTVTLQDNTGTLTASNLVFSNQTSQTINNANVTKAQASVILSTVGAIPGQSNSFAVNPAPLSSFAVTNTSGGNIANQGAGQPFDILITARDQFLNTVVGFSGSVSISLNTGSISPTSTNIANGSGTVTVTIPVAGNSRQVNVSGGGETGSSNTFNVVPQSLQSFSIVTINSPQTAGVPFQVTIEARDGVGGAGNIATDFNGTVNLSLNSGTLSPIVSGSFNQGTWTGLIEVRSLAGSTTGKRLLVDDGSGHSGQSNLFNVNPGAPAGSVTLSADPPTLEADGVSISRITSTTIQDAFLNNVGSGKLFTVTLNPSNLGTIVDADFDGNPLNGHQVATVNNILDFDFQVGTTGGNVNVSVLGGTAQGNVNIGLGSMVINSISATPVNVSRGQQGISVVMAVENLSASQITNVAANLTFTGSQDRTSDYTQSNSPPNIPAGQTRNITFTVGVNANAALEAITISGAVTGEIGGVPVSAPQPSPTDSWTVQRPALLQAESIIVDALSDTVSVGQQNNDLTVVISNPALANGTGAANVVIDNIQLKFFKDGVTDQTINFSFSPDGGNPTSIAAQQQANFDFTFGVGGTAVPGDYQIDVEVAGHDANSNVPLQDLSASVRGLLNVKLAPVLQILSIEPSPVSSFVAGQSGNWFVNMALRNNGPDPIDLDLSVAKTFIRFIIGSDRTSEYTILQPTALVLAGNNTLNDGATDTLRFTIDVTGTTPGPATITGRVEGIDQGTTQPVIDDTNDGGTGQVDITNPNLQLLITNTVPFNTPNQQAGGLGVVNIGQPFQVRVTLRNNLQEPVINVQVELTKDGGSNIALTTKNIDNIPANGGQASVDFDVTAALQSDASEIFTANILAATGGSTGQPASIGPAADDDATFRIETPASLAVQFTELEQFQTAGATFTVGARVVNSGVGQVSSGQLRLILPPSGYSFDLGSSEVQSFNVNQIVQWQVIAPNNGTPLENFRVEISQTPTDINRNTPAAVAVPFVLRQVQTQGTVLTIDNFAITFPDGAIDNVLSTQQDFTVEAQITRSDNLDSVQAELSLPTGGYAAFPGTVLSQALVGSGATTVSWRVLAPDVLHQTPRAIQVTMTGFDDSEERASVQDEFTVTAVNRANLDFDQFAAPAVVPVNQPFQVTARVSNLGDAGVEGNAILTLNLGSTGITTQELLSKNFTPGQPVMWNVSSPNVPTTLDTISVSVTVPRDENTTANAIINTTLRKRAITTAETGFLAIDSLWVGSPPGATNGTLSTDQEFVLQVEVTRTGAVDVQAEVVLPAGYEVVDGELTRIVNLINVSWRLRAPVTPLSPHFIKVNVSGKDENDENVTVNAFPDSLQFQVVQKAQLELLAEITAPASAVDRVLTVGQTFTIGAEWRKTGAAALNGSDRLRLTMPATGEYTLLSDSLIQTVPSNGLVNWTIRAPDAPTDGFQDFIVRVESRNATDENSNQPPPPLPPNDRPAITITVQTRGIGLVVTQLNDRKPTNVKRGATNVGVFGLSLENEGDDTITIDAINLTVREGSELLAPNSVFSRVGVVDYFNSSNVILPAATLTENNPLVLNFGQGLVIPAGQTISIEFVVDILGQSTANGFELRILSPQTDIVARDASASQVEIIDDTGQPITSAITAGTSLLFNASLQASFFNYPNPFNSNLETTLINYQLEQTSNLNIRIYTLLGELVRAYSFNATDPEGIADLNSRQIVWDGTNEKGQQVLNGVYVAVLTTNHGKATTKIAVIK
jgi:hypothetical protein